jgi:glycosyl transferase-like sugar-binding protein
VNVYFYWSGPDFDYGNYLAVASAAVHAGDRRIEVLVDEAPRDNPHFEGLSALPNVRVRPLVLDEWMGVEHARLYARMRFVAHRADLVRFCVLAREGGIYLDTDTLTCAGLTTVPDTLLVEDGKIVHIGVMSLPRGSALARAMVASLAGISDDDLGVYQSIVYRWTELVRRARPPVEFGRLADYFPVHWKEWELIFTAGGFDGDASSIRILHHYGYFSRRYTSLIDEAWLERHPCLFSEKALPVVRMLAKRDDGTGE